MHDFFHLCPNYVLLNDKTEYCEIPSDVKRCSQCLTNTVSAEYKQFSKETSIEKWRGYWKKILQEAEEILCFSNSSKEIFAKVYPKLINNVIVIPHDISGRYKDIYEPRITKEKRIGILGGINIAKGAYIVQNLVKYIDENNLNVKIILIGEISIDINSSSFYKTGRYKREDLPKIVKKQKITEFLIPSIWPETFSYTTDEIMQMGYPLTVFDIGAPAERVKDYKLGKIIKISEINKLFM
ncbi:MAG TPA: glycosyltransferase family 1 protein [Arcobacter sp.]|nr:glycosyltransferase family 1 protein [Arcobacter sp.]